MPAAPVISSPEPGRIDVLPETLMLTSSAFASTDPASTHVASEWEIWRVSGTTPVERVWLAQLASDAGAAGNAGVASNPGDAGDAGKLTRVSLTDGAYEGLSQDVGLFAWTDYMARVRYRSSRSECEWSEWSQGLYFRTDDGSSTLFDPTKIHDIHIDIPPESWDSINAEARPPGCVPHERNYYPVNVRVGEYEFPGAGGRVKGGCGSARRLTGKAGFKISLEWNDPAMPGCPEKRRLYGQKHLTLNNAVQDATFLHEWLGYRLYKAMGVPTPRTAFVRVHVNGELWGLYLHVESLGRRFLERWFDSHRGMMYEGTYWCDLVAENVPQNPDERKCLTAEFDVDECDTPNPGDDPPGYQVLAELVNNIAALPEGGFYPEIERFFEFDTFLSQWAVESVIAHWDGYTFNIINNYRVYHDPATDRWTIIPTGIDQTFRDDIDPYGVSSVLAQRCLAEEDCRAALDNRMAQAVNVFEQMNLAEEARTVAARIAPHVMEDPRKEMSYEAHVGAVEELTRWIEERPAIMREKLQNQQ